MCAFGPASAQYSGTRSKPTAQLQSFQPSPSLLAKMSSATGDMPAVFSPILVCVLTYTTARALLRGLAARLANNSTPDRSPALHAERVAAVCAQVQRWQALPSPRPPMCTKRQAREAVTCRTYTYKAEAALIDMDCLDHIVAVDAARRLVTVEPRVTMAQLCKALLPHQLTLPVVPELRQLTVGGLILGAGLETSSHLHGLFKDACVAMELLLADGSVRTVSAETDPELFRLVPFSYGTLCLALSFTLRLVPCQPLVQLQYSVTASAAETLQLLEHHARRGVEVADTRGEDRTPQAPPADFVEGLLFSPTQGVVITGRMVSQDEARDSGLPLFGPRWFSEWYYKHVQRLCFSNSKTAQMAELMPLEDYYFRHDRGIFWTLEVKFPWSQHWLARFLLGWALDRRLRRVLPERHAGDELAKEKVRVVQDAVVPAALALPVYQQLQAAFGLWPIWLCPLRVRRQPTGTELLAFSAEDPLYVDIGLYGKPSVPGYEPIGAHRFMERLLRQTGSFVGAYAISYVLEDELFATYNRGLYAAAREKYGADGAFVGLFDKIGCGEKEPIIRAWIAEHEVGNGAVEQHRVTCILNFPPKKSQEG